MKKNKGSLSRFLVGMASLFTVLIILNSCEKSTDEPGPNEVFIQGHAFNPTTITVPVNTTITWTNKDADVHTATNDTGGEINSGNISKNRTFSHTFATAGSYPYHCALHPAMTATVIVN